MVRGSESVLPYVLHLLLRHNPKPSDMQTSHGGTGKAHPGFPAALPVFTNKVLQKFWPPWASHGVTEQNRDCYNWGREDGFQCSNSAATSRWQQQCGTAKKLLIVSQRLRSEQVRKDRQRWKRQWGCQIYTQTSQAHGCTRRSLKFLPFPWGT